MAPARRTLWHSRRRHSRFRTGPEQGKPACGRYLNASGSADHRHRVQHMRWRAVPAWTAPAVPERLQLKPGDAGRDVEPGLALDAERLQRVGIAEAPDQEIAAAADPH